MVRKYVRKTKAPDKENLAKALVLHEEGLSIRKAARETGISHVTLSRAVNNKGYSKQHKVFSTEMEEELVEYLLTCSRINHGLTTTDLKKLAYSFATSNQIKTPTSWSQHKSTGKDWAFSFLQRHKNISVRKLEATGFNKHNVQEFFRNLEGLLSEYKFPAPRIFNMDETAITTVQVPPKITQEENAKQASQVTSGQKGIQVTAICCVSASGNSIPPTFVWPRKTRHNIDAYMRGTPLGSLGLYHSSGWMTEEIFTRWMDHFISHTKPSKDDPVLLLIGNHKSHLSISAICKAKESGVILMTFFPHTANKLQPLDVSVYGPLKGFYNSACNEWQLVNPGKTISLYDVGDLAAKAIMRAQKPESIISGYRETGIFPLNMNIFGDNFFSAFNSVFVPACVTERPLCIDDELETIVNPDNDQDESSLAEQNRSIASLSDIPSTSSIQTFQNCASPAGVRPYPKTGARKTAICKKRKSLIPSLNKLKFGITEKLIMQKSFR